MARLNSIFRSAARFRHIVGHFLPELRHERLLVLGSTIALLFSVALRLLEPWPLKLVLDHLLDIKPLRLPLLGPLEPMPLFAVVAASLVVIVALRSAGDYFKKVGFALIGNRVMSRIRGKLYRHLQSLSMSFHTKARSGDLLIRVIGDIKLLRDVVVTAMLPLLGSILLLISMFAVMFWMNWRLTLLAAVVFPLFAISSVRIGRKIHDAARKQRQREGAMAATAAEAISAVHVVQSLSLENHFDASFSSQNKRSLSEGVKTRRLAAKLERRSDILIAISSALVMWYAATLSLGGKLEPTYLIIFMPYLKRSLRPLQDLAKYAGRLAKATAAGERIVELLEQTPDIQDAPDAVSAPALKGEIQFSEVRFGYEPGADVHHRLDLTIPAGQFAAIVGPSGVGKSSLLHLILRLYDPLDGKIMIDGQDIRRWTLNSLRSQVSIVLQDTVLFAANVYENIALGAVDADADQIEAAARLANAHQFIQSLPEGYETVLGERGVNLSHGQRQRIAIARAAVRNAPILLLDEPTTGLDQENERDVHDALLRLAKQRTTVLVTHELRHAAGADVIFYLDGGIVSESGTHLQLMKQGGQYAHLYQMQCRSDLTPIESTSHGVTI